MPALVKALSQPRDMDMNFAALEFALGKIGPNASAAEATLVDKLTSKDDNVRMMSGWALAQISGSSPAVAAKAVPVLAAGLSLADMQDKLLAAETLGGFGPLAKDAAEALKKASLDADRNVAEAATASLKAIETGVGTSPAPPTSPTPAAVVYKPGDHVVTVEDKVEVGVAGGKARSCPRAPS